MPTTDNTVPSPPETDVREGHSTLLFMTDLEVIKKATDYLKSHGEKVAFEETEITLHRCDKETVICEELKGKTITYKGDYLQITLYPPARPPKPDYNHCFTVYLDENGNVLGYTRTSNE